jgi:glycosyltransferase involved in cell wall biosynthesis
LDERLVDRLIAPSEFVKNKFIEWGRNAFKIDVVPHFIATEKYVPVYAPGNEIAFIGRLSEEKGIGLLVAAMEKLPQIRLKIVGAGPMEKKLKDFCAIAGLKNVRFLGQLDHLKTMEEIGSSRFVVVPSLFYEPFGYLPLESGAMGKPVIAARIGALTENVKDGETGILFPPNDVKALCIAIEKFHGDEVKIRTMGRAARSFVEQSFRPEDHYERLMEIYAALRPPALS